MRTTTLIGRYQPPHPGHFAQFEDALADSDLIVIQIRDTVRDEDNPLTYGERVRAIEDYFRPKGQLGRIHFIRLPDPGCDLVVQIGREVGYKVKRFPPEVENWSGTNERALLRREGKL